MAMTDTVSENVFNLQSLLNASRVRAFLVHLGISLSVFSILLYLILYHWYPQPFFVANGGWQGLRIIVFVDVVLGPLLTAIVYKPGKPGLAIDLGIIALFQISALLWGLYVIAGQRPVLVVFTLNRLYSVPASDLPATGLSPNQIRRFGPGIPILYSKIPGDPDAKLALLTKSLKTGLPLHLMGNLYEALDAETLEKVKSASININGLTNESVEQKRRIKRFLAQHHAAADRFAYLPLLCSYREILVALDLRTKTIAGALDIPIPAN